MDCCVGNVERTVKDSVGSGTCKNFLDEKHFEQRPTIHSNKGLSLEMSIAYLASFRSFLTFLAFYELLSADSLGVSICWCSKKLSSACLPRH